LNTGEFNQLNGDFSLNHRLFDIIIAEKQRICKIFTAIWNFIHWSPTFVCDMRLFSGRRGAVILQAKAQIHHDALRAQGFSIRTTITKRTAGHCSVFFVCCHYSIRSQIT
jgi:hypothetical protein